MTKDGRGVPRGTRFRVPTYNPKSGDPYRPGSNFESRNATKLIELCTRLDISVAGFLNTLVELVEVDPSTGRPVGWPESVRLKEAG